MKIKPKSRIKQYFDAISIVAKNNFLSEAELNEIIKTNIIKAFQDKYNLDAKLEFIIDPQNEILKLINHSMEVVADNNFDPKLSTIEIPLSEALEIDPNIKIGDEISKEVNINVFMSNIKPILMQSLRERKKENIYEKHKNLIGKLIEVEVVNINNKGDVTFKLEDSSPAFMPFSKRNKKINLSIGQKTKVYVEEVQKDARESQILVSNGSKFMIKDYLMSEIPELQQNIIEIVSIARSPSVRSKIAIKSNDPNIDPIGAIVGPNGSRINAILEKMHQEKLDVIAYSDDINQFIANALEPAKIISVNDSYDEKGKKKENHKVVVTPNIHKTLAIGKLGVNVRLAIELTNIFIDIISLDEAKEKNISLLWNGTLNKEDLEKLESGQRLSRFNQKNSNKFNNGGNKNSFNKFNDLFDDAFSSVEEQLSNFDERQENIVEEINNNDSFEDDDFAFSDEDLKKMESAFSNLDFDLDDKNTKY